MKYHLEIDTGEFKYIPADGDVEAVARTKKQFKDKTDRF